MHFLKLSESLKIFRTTKFFIFAVFFITVFFIFLKIELFDYDFWWHIATGRYIVETGSLPDKDTFSYTSNLEENRNLFPERENFILKQYWLSQIMFYLIYDYTGPKGIIILRAVLLTLTLIIVFWRLQRWSVSLPVSFIFIFILLTLLTEATGERPVLFTILFTALTFFTLEDFNSRKDKRIFLLPPLMLLWANLHGGFIIGIVIIAVFMFSEGIKIILKKSAYNKKELILFYTATSLSLIFSFINPTGWDAFLITFLPRYKPFTMGVHEYYSPFLMYKNKIMQPHYGYIFLIFIFPFILMLRNKRINISHIILLSGLLIMSVLAFRFTVYYGIVGAMVLGREADILFSNLLKSRFSGKACHKILNGLTVVVLFSAMLFMAGFLNIEDISLDIARYYYVPAAAVDFIEKNKLEGNMFNNMGFGGYITWKLYPWKKTFIDSRSLNLPVIYESSWIESGADFVEEIKPITKAPAWKRLLNHYKINFVFLPLLNIQGDIPHLIFKLSESEDWIPVYYDLTSVIFVRNVEQNRTIIEKFKFSKEDIYNAIIFISAASAISDRINPRSLLSIGEIFYKMGRLQDAHKAYGYALNRMPGSSFIQERIRQIESEIKAKND